MRRVPQKLLVILLALPLAAFALLEARFTWDYLTHRRAPSLFMLESGYTGWVEIGYGKKDCPELPLRGGFLVHEILPDGKFCTSTPLPNGWAGDRYVYRDRPETNLEAHPQSGANFIWLKSLDKTDSPPRTALYRFYVGRENFVPPKSRLSHQRNSHKSTTDNKATGENTEGFL